MTETGTFVINGAERVIVSQLVRSPGIYYAIGHDKVGKELYSCTVIPNRGAWLEYETDSNDVFYVRVDRTRKVPISVLIRALGVGTNQRIIDLFGESQNSLHLLARIHLLRKKNQTVLTKAVFGIIPQRSVRANRLPWKVQKA